MSGLRLKTHRWQHPSVRTVATLACYCRYIFYTYTMHSNASHSWNGRALRAGRARQRSSSLMWQTQGRRYCSAAGFLLTILGLGTHSTFLSSSFAVPAVETAAQHCWLCCIPILGSQLCLCVQAKTLCYKLAISLLFVIQGVAKQSCLII